MQVVIIEVMTLIMNDSHIVSISQIKELAKLTNEIKFKGADKKEAYRWIDEALIKFRYFSSKKKEKSAVKKYLIQMTGYSDAQLTRLIKKKKSYGKIFKDEANRHKFTTTYTPEDIALLIRTDANHERLSGPATKRIFEREYNIFGNKEYQRLKDISIAHIYNLRGRRQYQSNAIVFNKTKPVKSMIGERTKPNPNGKPGYLRVDTVHQGDKDKEKGVYHINLVDEIVQWEIVGSVPTISEKYLEILLEDLILQFPFVIRNFHSDNGSEFINQVVAKLLNKLLIKQTKSRARYCNDNALAESKNGSVIRKHMGHLYIPKKHANEINSFYKKYLNIYLNYHRPCGFATTIINSKGKEKKIYDQYMTPYEKLKSLTNAQQYLKSGVSFKQLDKIAYEKSDNEFAALMQKEKEKLFKNIYQSNRQKFRFQTTLR